MNDKTLHVLEYDKILTMLSNATVSEIGRAMALELRPSVEAAQVKTLLAQTEEAESIYIKTGRSPIDYFPDMRMCLKQIHAAIALTPGELVDLGQCFRASRIAREGLTKDETPGVLSHMASQLSTHRSIEEEISRCIVDRDEIADGASPALAQIRRQMRITNERARDRLNSMIHSTTFQKYLQEPLVTMRNGRFVLPVKQEFKQQVPGLVHDQSGSGATLFIEPMAVVELGNLYKQLVSEEQEEIERILEGLTALVAPYGDELYNSLSILGTLDVIFAKAILARNMHCTCPKLNTDGSIRIQKGRHPLLPADTVVPVDIWIGEAFQTLIITGPNTGGKTVTLKTVGLLTAMAQTGLFIPAEHGTVLSVYDQIFADIGDEQSIEQSLSTFSSHMVNIVRILEGATGRALVLLDELGAGTDPIEGAALAMAILETLHSRGCTTIATTHYSEMKAFAMTRDGMENASMEFDVDRLCPTYHLFIGIPGKSNAFEISKRLGLEHDIVEKAREFLKKEDVQFEDVIQSAQTQYQLAESERRKAQEARWELERIQSELQREQKKLDEEKTTLRKKAKEEARKVVQETKEEMEQLIIGLRSLQNVDMQQVERAIQQARDKARKKEQALAEPLSTQTQKDGKPPKQVRPGERVRVISLGQNATVLKPADSKGEVQVQAGIMKFMARLEDLRLIDEVVKPTVGGGRISLLSDKEQKLELDVRGKLVDEAIVEVDRYIDNASISGRTELYIIHGKGTGALRAGIQAYLKNNPRVKSYRLGNYGEGDAGVTVVMLK